MKERKTLNTFLIWKRRHCKQGTITQLKVNDNDLIFTDKEILKECESFYQDLYSCKVGTDNQEGAFFFPQQENRKVLNNDEQFLCEGELGKYECLEALKSMAPDKSPGTDGLPCEFYKVFWNDVAEILIKSFNYSYEIGKFSISQRRGIIKLIPKKDADLNLIKKLATFNTFELRLQNSDKSYCKPYQNVLAKTCFL